MKIRVTHEITDQQRLTIATAAGGQGFTSREGTVAWIDAVVEEATAKLDEAFTEARDLLIKKLEV